MTTHMFGHRTVMVHELGDTVSLCGKSYPDLGDKLRPKADLREFAVDAEATCRACKKARERRRPGWLRKLWRKLRGKEEPTEITIAM